MGHSRGHLTLTRKVLRMSDYDLDKLVVRAQHGGDVLVFTHDGEEPLGRKTIYLIYRFGVMKVEITGDPDDEATRVVNDPARFVTRDEANALLGVLFKMRGATSLGFNVWSAYRAAREATFMVRFSSDLIVAPK